MSWEAALTGFALEEAGLGGGLNSSGFLQGGTPSSFATGQATGGNVVFTSPGPAQTLADPTQSGGFSPMMLAALAGLAWVAMKGA